jgi:hypothetical protein
LDKDTFLVAPSDEGWTLSLNGQRMTSFEDQHAAQRAATVAARLSRDRGRIAEVLTDDDGYDDPDGDGAWRGH